MEITVDQINYGVPGLWTVHWQCLIWSPNSLQVADEFEREGDHTLNSAK
jgi:hypothetical protein